LIVPPSIHHFPIVSADAIRAALRVARFWRPAICEGFFTMQFHTLQDKPAVRALAAAFAAIFTLSPLHAKESAKEPHFHEHVDADHDHDHGQPSPDRDAANGAELEPIVVTAPPMQRPLEVSLDAKAPQQPLPANDGANFLKTIPGMSVIRKGGTSGDPVFRGMAASRLNILLDGEQILGGCGGRMDPPTAYIFPDAFDNVILTKGPQTVLYGPGASAGTVRFERDPVYFSEPGWQANSAVTGASFGRHDIFLDVKAGSPQGYVQGIVTHARSGNYEDGDGKTVHSRYERHSATAILGWTPDRNTRLQFSAVRSDAEAAYADRSMDGSLFKRENYDFRFEKSAIGTLLNKVEAQIYYNYIDHVMDNYSLRHAIGMAMASNPDRRTTGGRFALTFSPNERLNWVLGVDQQANLHRGRSGGRSGTPTYYRDQRRVDNMRFNNYGLFSELIWQLNSDDRLVAGLRGDHREVKDKRATSATTGQKVDETLASGFFRYERDFSANSTLYAGLGHSERAPDFWELMKASTTSTSAVGRIGPEKTTQIDLGVTWQSGSWQAFVSGFYSKIDDYILIDSNYQKPGGAVTVSRNIRASTWGGEAGVNYRFSPQWKGTASLAHVRGENDTDHHALGQMPPLEGRLGLDWESGPWSAGALWRLVARQNRYALNQGNIVGQDLGETAGFGVLSMHGGYRWNKRTHITFGIDNLFDKTYAEHISRSAQTSLIQGYEQTTRVNEPGRTLWIRAQIALD
jgi:iron complex outermembrane receptor protein